MDAVGNPYSPGAGRRPAALVGRDPAIAEWQNSLRRAEKDRIDSPQVLIGRRGVGKTVLLARFASEARERDWVVARIEASHDLNFREALGEALYEPLSDMVRPGVGERVVKALKTASSFKASYSSDGVWSFGLDFTASPGGGADTGVIETDLRKLIRELADAAASIGVGLAVLIDEAQDLEVDDLRALCVVAHQAAQDDWRFLLAFAGLPSLRGMLAQARSYSERFRYVGVEELDESAARAALILPARDEGVEWSDAALDEVITASGCYPYFLQQFGKETWDVAGGSPIDRRDAAYGIALGNNHLDRGFFSVRWDRATKAEKDYMRAMAQDSGEDSQSGEIASRLGRSIGSLGPTRANLISKGLVFAPNHGVVAFTVPHMHLFIAKQPLA
ncbi:ATP-binding protein [Gordonia sp. VNQ95]|jgi:hypothetical protein|uniref:ATP-binding protein n=1 Tax=Gordonia TaxID=2053 RepID=UPI0032B521B9